MARFIACMLLLSGSASGFQPPIALRGLTLRAAARTSSTSQDVAAKEVSASGDRPLLLGRRTMLGSGTAAATAVALGWSTPSVAAAAPAGYDVPSNDVVYRPAAGSLVGKTVLITGANTGLGLESAKRLLAAGARVVVTARTQAKVDATVAKLQGAEAAGGGKATGAVLDLASLASVKSFPARLETATGSKNVALDVLLNNAGVMAIPERLPTDDGFERTVGVNHLGHFALTGVLLPSLKRARNGFRVVTVSSEAHRFASADGVAKAIDAGTLETGGKVDAYSGWGAYGLSKAANVLFTQELQRRLDEAGLHGSAVCLHPGAVQTDLARYITNGQDGGDVRRSETSAPSEPEGRVGKWVKGALDKVILPIDRGANTQVFLAAGRDVGGDYAQKPPALYFDAMKPAAPNGASTDPAAARRLWAVSEQLTGTAFLD